MNETPLISVIIGDMHLGKKILGIQPNPYDNSIDLPGVISKWNAGTIQHIKENIVPIVQRSYHFSEIVRWIFLGDIIDYPRNTAIVEFESLIEYLLNQNENWFIDVLVGNHDTSKIGDLSRTPLSKFHNQRNKIIVHSSISIQHLDDAIVVYMPYLKRQELLPHAYRIRNEVAGEKPLIVFSHNNFYVADSFLGTPMIPKSRLEEALNRSLLLFNGHIHRTHYEPGYYQVGSSVPTSFKETPQASGTCIFENGKLRILRNNKVMLLSISSPYHIEKLKWFLEQAVEKRTIILLRVGVHVQGRVLDMVKTYKNTVPGIMLDSQKHT